MRPWGPFRGPGWMGTQSKAQAARLPASLDSIIRKQWTFEQGIYPLRGPVLHSVSGTENKSNRVMKALKNNTTNKNEKNSPNENACHSMNSVAWGCHRDDTQPITVPVIPTLLWHSVYLITVFPGPKIYTTVPQYPWVLHPKIQLWIKKIYRISDSLI